MSNKAIAIENLGAFAKNFDEFGVTESVKDLLMADPIAAARLRYIEDDKLLSSLEELVDEIVGKEEPSQEEFITIGGILAVTALFTIIGAFGIWFNRVEQLAKRVMKKIDENSPLKFRDDAGDRVLDDVLSFSDWNERVDVHLPVLKKILDIETVRDEDFVDWALKQLKPYILEVKDGTITKFKGHVLRIEKASKVDWTEENTKKAAKTLSEIYPILSKLSETYSRAKKQVKKDNRNAKELKTEDSDELKLTNRNSKFLKSYYTFMRKDMWEVVGTLDGVLDELLAKSEKKKEDSSSENLDISIEGFWGNWWDSFKAMFKPRPKNEKKKKIYIPEHQEIMDRYHTQLKDAEIDETLFVTTATSKDYLSAVKEMTSSFKYAIQILQKAKELSKLGVGQGSSSGKQDYELSLELDAFSDKVLAIVAKSPELQTSRMTIKESGLLTDIDKVMAVDKKFIATWQEVYKAIDKEYHSMPESAWDIYTKDSGKAVIWISDHKPAQIIDTIRESYETILSKK